MKFQSRRRGYRTAVRWQPLVAILLIFACSKKTPTPPALRSENSGRAAEVAKTAGPPPSGVALAAVRCRSLGKGRSYTLGGVSGPAASTDRENDDEEQEEPFATTLGNALAYDGGFLLSAIDYRTNRGFAVVAKIQATVDQGSLLELGRVYGDVEPPRIALSRDRAVVAVFDAASGKRLLKVGTLSLTHAPASVEWVSETAPGNDESPAFALASSGDGVVVAWDEFDKSTRHGVVRFRNALLGGGPKHSSRAASTSPAAGKGDRVSRSTADRTADDIDVEAPQLVARPSGFWLGYLAASIGSKTKLDRPLGLVRKPVPNEEEGRPVVDPVHRSVHLLALDELGAVVGQRIAVTDLNAHVVAFDMEATGDGSVLVAYREANVSPGVESDEIALSQLHADGTMTRLKLEDERFGAGTPVLLPATEGAAAGPHWLFMSSKSGEGFLIALAPDGKSFGPVVIEPLLANAEPLLRQGNTLLVARTRGKLVEIEQLDCQGTASAPRVRALDGGDL